MHASFELDSTFQARIPGVKDGIEVCFEEYLCVCSRLHRVNRWCNVRRLLNRSQGSGRSLVRKG